MTTPAPLPGSPSEGAGRSVPLGPREAVLRALAHNADAMRRGARPARRGEVAAIIVESLTGLAPATPTESLRQTRADVPPALATLIDRALVEPQAAARADGRWLADLAAAVGLGAAASAAARARATDGDRRVRRHLRFLGLALAVAGACAVLLAMRPSSSEDSVPPAGADRERAMLLQGLTERGDALLRRDDFAAATAAYLRYAELAPELNGAALLRAWTDARLAYARHLATDFTGSEAYAARALGSFDRGGLGDHPWRMPALAALGTALAQRGAFEEAADAFLTALGIRERLLGLPRRDGIGPALVSALERIPADAEWDEDGLLDIFELALGLDNQRLDSDGDGVADGDERGDDGWRHVVRYGLAPDATRVLGTAGSRAPSESGFWQTGMGEATPIAGDVPALRLAAPTGLFFHMPFSSEQKRATALQGWRLLMRVDPEHGDVVASVDARPAQGACRLTVSRDGRHVRLSLNGATARVARDEPEGLELVEMSYEPTRSTVQVRLRNTVVLEQAASTGSAVSPWGLSFGVENREGDVQAWATLAALLFEIRF